MPPSPQADPGRRTLLHAAWAAPTVVVASSVPAFAASVPSSTPPVISVVVSSNRGFDGGLRVTHTIRNTGQTPTTALELDTTLMLTSGTVGTTVVVEDQPWTATTSGTGTARTVTLTKDNGVIAAGGQITLSFRINAVRAAVAGVETPLTGTLTSTPTPTPGAGAAGNGTINDAPL